MDPENNTLFSGPKINDRESREWDYPENNSGRRKLGIYLATYIAREGNGRLYV